MIFWIDAHLHEDLASWLGVRFKVTAKYLREIGLRDEDDDVLVDAAKRFGDIVIITKDSDFAHYVRTRGVPPQVLWLRCGNATKLEVQALLARKFEDALMQFQAGAAIVEITPD
jgi:predicted nuclease of predicted toxin-antitoxin system